MKPEKPMNGAHRLVHTLLAGGIDTCFTNPGTSEMHFVAALDQVAGMRCVLGLFEGVVTGAADGYWRMADRPACTLLHLGPGLANGLANLHNARKARSGIVNVVGEHARSHIALNAPLTSDIAALARPMSDWVGTVPDPGQVGAMAQQALLAAVQPPGAIATLVLPADCAWGEEGPGASDRMHPQMGAPRMQPRAFDAQAVEQVARQLRSGEPTLLLLGGRAARASALRAAARVAACTGCGVMTEFYVPRIERGAGRPVVARIPYAVDQALAVLKPWKHIVQVGAAEPVAFFAYPDKPGRLAPAEGRFSTLASAEEDLEGALQALAEALDPRAQTPVPVAAYQVPDLSTLGEAPFTPEGIAAVISALIPENAIVIDEAVTSGRHLGPPTATSAAHDWLTNMGGSIGFALPNAIGAAIACPDRKVLVLTGDGSALYTQQALWTMAREGLDITVLVFANHAYQILRAEYAGVGAGEPGKQATRMLSLQSPRIDWVGMSAAMGVPAVRATHLRGLADATARALAGDGPTLIEVAL
jgi:acetolactate synthase I/II/III large subunit